MVDSSQMERLRADRRPGVSLTSLIQVDGQNTATQEKSVETIRNDSNAVPGNEYPLDGPMHPAFRQRCSTDPTDEDDVPSLARAHFMPYEVMQAPAGRPYTVPTLDGRGFHFRSDPQMSSDGMGQQDQLAGKRQSVMGGLKRKIKAATGVRRPVASNDTEGSSGAPTSNGKCETGNPKRQSIISAVTWSGSTIVSSLDKITDTMRRSMGSLNIGKRKRDSNEDAEDEKPMARPRKRLENKARGESMSTLLVAEYTNLIDVPVSPLGTATEEPIDDSGSQDERARTLATLEGRSGMPERRPPIEDNDADFHRLRRLYRWDNALFLDGAHRSRPATIGRPFTTALAQASCNQPVNNTEDTIESEKRGRHHRRFSDAMNVDEEHFPWAGGNARLFSRFLSYADEESADEESAVEESAVKEPAVEEPAVEEPAVEEPAVEEPAVEESAVEESVNEEEQ